MNNLERFLKPRTWMQSLSVQLAPFSGAKPGLRPTASGEFGSKELPSHGMYHFCISNVCLPGFTMYGRGLVSFRLLRPGFIFMKRWVRGGYIHCTCFLTSHIKAIVLMLELKPLTSPAWGTISIVVWLEAALGHYPERTQGIGGVQVQFYIIIFF